MRRADLRQLDRNFLMTIMSVFCALSFLYLVLLVLGVLSVNSLKSTTYLWGGYILLAICIGGVALFSKNSPTLYTHSAAEVARIVTPECTLEKGKAYMIKEAKNEKTLRVFCEAMKNGVAGLYLTRSNPKNLKADNATILWLTELEAPNSINPSDLEEITYTINQFLQKSKQGFIVIDGVDYLISFVGFVKVLHLIQDLKDTVALRGSILVIPFFESTLEKNNMQLLEKELDVIS